MVPAAPTALGAAALPPVTVISAAASKPVTTLLKVKVATKGLPLWAEGASIVTVGGGALRVAVSTRSLPRADSAKFSGLFAGVIKLNLLKEAENEALPLMRIND